MQKKILLHLSAEEHDAWKESAHDARLSLSEWIRQRCREQLATEAIDREPLIGASVIDGKATVVLVPPVSKPEPIVKATPRPGFKRSPKCVSDKCRRLQRATCTPCIQANSKGFA